MYVVDVEELFNKCHAPTNGRFCGKSGAAPGRGKTSPGRITAPRKAGSSSSSPRAQKAEVQRLDGQMFDRTRRGFPHKLGTSLQDRVFNKAVTTLGAKHPDVLRAQRAMKKDTWDSGDDKSIAAMKSLHKLLDLMGVKPAKERDDY